MKRLLFVVLLAAFGGSVSAQQIRFAPVLGVNVSHGLYSSAYKAMIEIAYENSIVKYRPVPGFVFGGIAEYSLTEQLSVRSGLLLNMKGSRIKVKAYGVNESETADVKFKMSYLEIPVVVAYRLGATGLTLSGGPGFGFAVGGKAKSEETYTYKGDTESSRENIKLVIGSDANQHDLKPLEVSFNLAIGKDIMVADRALEVSVNLQPSISKWNTASKIESDLWSRNFVIGFRAAYFFSFQ